MTSDLEQLRRLVGPYDPAAGLRADPFTGRTTLRRITGGHRREAGVRRHGRLAGWVALAGAAAAAIGASLLLPSALKVDRADALSFHERGRYLEVRILDPTADPARYRKEFAAHGLNVDLRLQPASPSLVGKLMLADDGGGGAGPGNSRIEGVGGPGCGEIWCQAGARIPLGMRGPITLAFGRSARPGEPYFFTGDPAAPGEPLAGLTPRGRTLAEVMPLLRQRGVTVTAYLAEPPESSGGESTNWNYSDHVLRPDQVSPTWYVSEAFDGSARNTVELVVGPTARR